MFEKWRIKEHMEVADSTGRHIGTVDEVEDNRIKLTRSDSTDGSHHYLDWESVDRIEDNRVYLRPGTPLPAAYQTELASAGAGRSAATDAALGGSGGGASAATDAALGRSSSANMTGSQGASQLPGEDNVLFGTSGHGTGMGGSGTS